MENVTVRDNNNEVELSNDLGQLTQEIKQCQAISGKSIFEIGRRLKHVKENDLAHGEFGKWVESVNMNKTTANHFIKIVTELNECTYTNLGEKSLYLIATMPAEDRDKEYQLDNGKTKKPADMTVKELKETRRKNKGLPIKPAKPKQIEVEPEIEQNIPDNSDKIAELELENKKLKDELAEAKELNGILQQKIKDMKNDVEKVEDDFVDIKPTDDIDFDLTEIPLDALEESDRKIKEAREKRIAEDDETWADVYYVYHKKVGEFGGSDGREKLKGIARLNDYDEPLMYRAVEYCADILKDNMFGKENEYDDDHKLNAMAKLIIENMPEIKAKRHQDKKIESSFAEKIKQEHENKVVIDDPYEVKGGKHNWLDEDNEPKQDTKSDTKQDTTPLDLLLNITKQNDDQVTVMG